MELNILATKKEAAKKKRRTANEIEKSFIVFKFPPFYSYFSAHMRVAKGLMDQTCLSTCILN